MAHANFIAVEEQIILMKKRTTISDIAKALGLSITTVSFILNGKSKERRISEASTKRVLDYVKKIGYKPSQLIRNRGGHQMNVLAIIAEDIGNPFFLAVRKHIEKIAAGSGYQIIYCSTGNDTQRTQQFIRLCIDKEVDGIIITPCEGVEEAVVKLKKQLIPVVLFDRRIPTLETSYIISDDRSGAYEAAKHLLEQGNKRVGFVTLYSNQPQMRERLDGYMDAVDEFQKQSFIRKLSIDDPEIAVQMVEFVVENNLEAIVFANHYLAINGLKGFKDHAVALPSVVAFEDHELFPIYTPSISVVTQQALQLAEGLMQTLIAEKEGKLKENRKVVVPYTLIVRESSTVRPV